MQLIKNLNLQEKPGMKDRQTFFLDTNIFIYFFNGDERFGGDVRKIFSRLVSNKMRAITSVITQTELFSLAPPENDVQELLGLFLETPNLEILSINTKIAVTASRLRRQYGFRMPDSLQLAAALEHKADFFVTTDSTLKKCREISVSILKEAKKKEVE